MNNGNPTLRPISESTYDALYQLLTQEMSIYETLTGILKEKRQALIDNDLAGINKLTIEEQRLLNKSNGLSDARNGLIKQVFNQWGVEQSTVTLRDLMKYSGKTADPDWSRLYKKLKLTLNEVTHLNNENQVLVGTALQFLKDLVQMTLSDGSQAQQTYGDDGLVNTSPKTQKLLDYQI